jgi:adenylate cyclase
LSGERVERRLAAILAADVAGYSRLMGQDETGTLARLRAHRREFIDPKISEHKGRIVKTTGDGLLVEFPSVVEAVACAAAIQREMTERNTGVPEEQRIAFRVGVNLGDVIVQDGDIHGDGVNVAARLEALAEPGGICISSTVRDHIGDRLECVFDDMGEQVLKNIARPVRLYRVRTTMSEVTIVGSSLKGTPALALPDKPSIAVLPFINMSNDPEQEFFADGITEDIITALCRYPSLFVIARNSCFTYKGQSIDVKQIGRELGVRYVLEGSLRKSGNRIRVTGQLVEAETGNHLWAARYDRDLAEIFAVQDEITQAATIAIAPAIAAAEQQRAMRKAPESLDAWAAFQRGLWHLVRYSAADNATAQRFFRQAVNLDPTFSGGHRALALAQGQAAFDFQIGNTPGFLSEIETLARRAVALDNADAEAHACLSVVFRQRGDVSGALTEAEHALVISPNLSRAHTVFAQALIFSGRPKEGVVSLKLSFRLDPRVRSADRANFMALGLYFAGEYDDAIEAATAAIQGYPEYPHLYRWLAAALGQVGRLAEAGAALERAIAISPGSFDMYVRNRPLFFRPEDHEHMVEGLQKAGWAG